MDPLGRAGMPGGRRCLDQAVAEAVQPLGELRRLPGEAGPLGPGQLADRLEFLARLSG